MKKVVLTRIIPFSILSFSFIDKWRFNIIENGSGYDFFSGFPLVYNCPGWHTSLSLQIFILELILNVVFHITFWSIIFLLIRKRIKKINKIISTIFIVISYIILALNILILLNPDNVFELTNPYETKTLKVGYSTIFYNTEKPDISEFISIQKKKIRNSHEIKTPSLQSHEIEFIEVQKEYPSLNNYIGEFVENIVFISPPKKLELKHKNELLELFQNPINYKTIENYKYRFVCNSGFIISKNDTLSSSISLTEDYKYFKISFNKDSIYEINLEKIQSLKNLIERIKRTPNNQ